MTVERKRSVLLTRKELWELMNVFEAGYEPGPGNELAMKVSEKLHATLAKFNEPHVGIQGRQDA